MTSNNKKVLACFGQLNRNPEFRITTKIIEDKAIIVQKIAYSSLSNSHIKSIYSNHITLSKFTKKVKNFRVAEAALKSPSVLEFQYIKGRNMEGMVYDAVIRADYKAAIALIDKIFTIIDSLSIKDKSDEYGISKLINDHYKSQKKKTFYMSPGIVDFNLDNFILDKNNNLVAFDCEWSFDQPITVDYIKTRILHTFFARRSDSFSFLPDESKIFTIISEADSATYIPKDIYNKYAEFLNKDSLKRYLQAEDVFQTYVNKSHRIKTSEIYNQISISDSNTPRITFPVHEELLQSKLQDSLNIRRGLMEENAALSENIRLIQSSRLFRIGTVLRNTIIFRIIVKLRSVLRRVRG